MAKFIFIDLNTRVIAVVGSLLLLMLIAGAGEISANLQERIQKRQVERLEWVKITAQMFSHMESEKQVVWNNIAIDSSQLLLQASTVKFTRIPHTVVNGQ